MITIIFGLLLSGISLCAMLFVPGFCSSGFRPGCCALILRSALFESNRSEARNTMQCDLAYSIKLLLVSGVCVDDLLTGRTRA